MNDLENITINLGVFYIREFEKDKSIFVSIMKKFDSVASFADFFYFFLVGKKIIPTLETIPDQQKKYFWIIVKDEQIKKNKKIKLCRGIYCLEAMIPMVGELEP